MRKPFFGAIVACLVLAACSGQMADQITELNQVQQKATAQILLLNVLRARVKEPLAYSRLDVLRGSSDMSGGVAVNIPFGPAGGDRSGAPFFSAGTGTSTDLTPHDDQDFYRGILTPVTPDTWALYQDQNWPPDVLFHLFVEDIKLPENDYRQLMDDVRSFCTSNAGVAEVAQQCGMLHDSEAKIANEGSSCLPIVHLNGEARIYELSNDPGNRCDLWQFEAFTHALLIMGFRITKEEIDVPIGPIITNGLSIGTFDWPFKLHDADIRIQQVGSGYQVVQVKSSYGVRLANLPCPGSATVAVAAQSDLSATTKKLVQKAHVSPTNQVNPQCDKSELGGLNISITTRSPDGMVYYLGEVARAMMPIDSSKEPMTLMVHSGSGAEHPLLNIVTDDFSDDPVANVTFEGTGYIVPSGGNDLTMQVFELLQQIFALYNKAPAAPATTAVTVVP